MTNSNKNWIIGGIILLAIVLYVVGSLPSPYEKREQQKILDSQVKSKQYEVLAKSYIDSANYYKRKFILLDSAQALLIKRHDVQVANYLSAVRATGDTARIQFLTNRYPHLFNR